MGLSTSEIKDRASLQEIVEALRVIASNSQPSGEKAIMLTIADGFEIIDQRLKDLTDLTD